MAAFGIDFGTSNSAIGTVSPEGEVRVVRWGVPEGLAGESGATSATMPTVIFAPNYESGMQVGWDAIDRYLFTGLDGRFMQSIKAFLPASSFTGTVVRNRHRTIEQLVSVVLRHLVDAADRQLGGDVRNGRIVLGRPARFSLDPEEDRLAEKRLLEAARLSGLPEVTLMIEPLAAAISYEAEISSDEIVMVVDLGGGTSDFTVIEVGPSHRRRKDRAESVLAAGGVPVAGDAMDGEVVRSRLFDRFGYGSSYSAFGQETRVPHWIFHKLKRWNHVSFLKSKKHLEFLRQVAKTSDRREDIERLIEVVDFDLSYVLFRAVERAKREVQSAERSVIQDEEHSLPLEVELTAGQFEEATADLVSTIRATAAEVLSQASLPASRVDAVFLTGGTSLVREVRSTFSDLFGAEKLQARGTFTSVVDGLSRAAQLD